MLNEKLTISTEDSECSAATCSINADSVNPIRPQNGHVNDWACSTEAASPP